MEGWKQVETCPTKRLRIPRGEGGEPSGFRSVKATGGRVRRVRRGKGGVGESGVDGWGRQERQMSVMISRETRLK